ncbi:hypothetical protein BUALT_Bualt07G0081000 [Buddleja alternifolia]|uniref:Peptidase A1 domain-containing protein n=1 Tax=Buddleja alternifolia TaxID=168488 RepID=A0AAV6XJZ4_9LAMI|nr:hypothetical protein BUALT_Bualt07G0081000 [Buddleja alternifolia]
MTQISPLLILSLILIIIIPPSAVALSNYEVLDVSASLSKALQVFSNSDDLDLVQEAQQLQPLSSSSSSFSVTLHPRSSLHRHHRNNNYTSLTLSRLARDAARVHSILSKHSRAAAALSKPQQLESPLISGAKQGSGEYFARIGVGRPAKDSLMVIDTGSDVTWLQCQPCSNCYDQTNPIFNPSSSSTYKPLNCQSDKCSSLQVSACRRTNTCLYQVSYGDGSYTVGDFATETISFASSGGSVDNIALGCGHDNQGLFAASDGLLGLGRGALSLPSQIKATSFSYCLVNRDSTSSSTLEFNSAHPSDSVLAPLLKNSLISTFHYVGLTGISVGGRPVDIPASLFEIGNGRGGVIVDSGTAVTRLRTEVYNLVRDSFARLVQNLPSAGDFSLFDTCYDLSSMTTARVPTVSFQFSGGKTLPLPPTNYLIPVDNAGKFCFAFAGTSGQLSIIGNAQQQGTRVSYDLANNYIGFSPNKC